MRHLLSTLYGMVVARRNRGFDAGKGVHHAALPVVSVGNVSMGGTGKSPFVILLARLLRDLGHTPAVVSRGYGRRSRGVVVVADHDRILTDAATAGDELLMIARALPGTVTVAAEHRLLGCTRVERLYPAVDAIILDDGFQHRHLARDADIVLVDRPTLDHPRVMPAGLLREPLTSLRRASLVVCTPGVDDEEIRGYSTAPLIHVHTEVEAWVRHGVSHDEAPVPPPGRVVLLTAIAHASRVVRTCAEYDVAVAHHAEYRDHHAFTEKDVDEVIAECRRTQCTTVLTTEKDLTKLLGLLGRFHEAALEVVVLRIRTVCHEPDLLRSFLVSTMEKGKKRADAKSADESSA